MIEQGFLPEEKEWQAELITCYKFCEGRFQRLINTEVPESIALLCIPLGLLGFGPINKQFLESSIEHYQILVQNEQETVQRITEAVRKKVFTTWEGQQRQGVSGFNLEALCLTEDEVRKVLSPKETDE